VRGGKTDEDDPQGPLLKYAGPAWIQPSDEPSPAPNWLNGRAIAGVWRDTLPFVAGGLKAHTQFPRMMPGAGWRPNPEPDSDLDVDQAIAAKLHLGLRLLPILAVAQLVVVEPGVIQGVPDWDDDGELCEYAPRAALPASPLFLDLESREGWCATWEVESWPGPFNLRGALVWRAEGLLSIVPFGSLDGRHPWGGTDYQAWSRWIFLAADEVSSWPAPGPGDCLTRPDGAVLSWVQTESGSVCANQAAIAYHLARRALRLLWMLELLKVELVSPLLPRAERRRAQRAGQKIGLIPAGLRELPRKRPEDETSWAQMTAKCPIPNTHARLNQAHALWHEALDGYHDPKGFVAKVNLLIQTLRNVTWVLQKEIAPHAQLTGWYTEWQIRMGADPRLRWVRDTRNEIVKQRDLSAHSQARVRIVGEVLHSSGIDIDVDPGQSADEIVRGLSLAALPDRARREGTLLVERRWIVDGFPNDELLDVLARCYSVLAHIVDEAHERLDGAMSTCEESADDPCGSWRFTHHASGRLPCMSAGREARTSRRDLTTGAPTRVTSITISRPPPDDEVIKRRYAAVKWERLAPDAGVFDIAENFHQSGRGILLADGYHVTLAWLLRDRQPVSMHQLTPHNQRDKYLMMESLADEATQLGADAVIITSEAWEAAVTDRGSALAQLRASERVDRTEALITHALQRDGTAKTWRSAMNRSADGLKLDDPVTDDHVPPLLRPMVEAWSTWT
jgi:hypothetical protein